MGIQRQRLSDRVAEELRRRITGGVYSVELPSEVQLAADLGVSRMVLRDGLVVLCGEGLLKKEKGKRTVVCAAALSASRNTPNRVTLLVGSRPRAAHALASRVLLLLHSELLLKDFLIEWIEDNDGTTGHLERIVAAHPDRIWILFGVSREYQIYFARRQIAAVVLGTCHEDVQLPSVDADYAAIAFHAIGMLKTRDYQRVLLVRPEIMLGGDNVSLAAFQKCAASTDLMLDVMVFSAGRKMGSVLQEWVSSDAGLGCVVVFRSATALAVLTALLGNGLRVPGDVGLISRDINSAFAEISPAICHYEADILRVARSVAQIVHKLARGTSSKIRDLRVIPSYCGGETV